MRSALSSRPVGGSVYSESPGLTESLVTDVTLEGFLLGVNVSVGDERKKDVVIKIVAKFRLLV